MVPLQAWLLGWAGCECVATRPCDMAAGLQDFLFNRIRDTHAHPRETDAHPRGAHAHPQGRSVQSSTDASAN